MQEIEVIDHIHTLKYTIYVNGIEASHECNTLEHVDACTYVHVHVHVCAHTLTTTVSQS